MFRVRPAFQMTTRSLLPLLSLALSVGAGCDSSVMTAAPAPSPSGFPPLTANATAAVNLEPVLRLERARSRSSRLIAVSGIVNSRGRLAGADPWHYTFREAGDVAGAVHQWRIDSNGAVTHKHLGICDLAFSNDLSAELGLDSDLVIVRALGRGAGSFLRDHESQDRFAVIYGDTDVQVIVYTADCYRPWVLLDRRSGDLVTASLDCTVPMGHPCVGPGVY